MLNLKIRVMMLLQIYSNVGGITHTLLLSEAHNLENSVILIVFIQSSLEK